VRAAGIAGLPHDDDFDDTEKLVIDLYNVVVANGQFAGGGLPIAPQANLSDGLLDVEAGCLPKCSSRVRFCG
jgi:hypothetical protein